MTTKNPAVKQLIFDVVNFSDEVDEKGQTLPRKTFKKDLYKTVIGLNKKLDDHSEYCVDVQNVFAKAREEKRKNLTQEEVNTLVWKKRADFIEGEAVLVGSVRFLDGEMEITQDEKNVIATYWKETSEIKDCGTEALEEFEALIV